MASLAQKERLRKLRKKYGLGEYRATGARRAYRGENIPARNWREYTRHAYDLGLLPPVERKKRRRRRLPPYLRKRSRRDPELRRNFEDDYREVRQLDVRNDVPLSPLAAVNRPQGINPARFTAP